MIIRGLTLHRPMSAAIAHLDKRVENRPQAPPLSLVGHYLAIHGGKKWDDAYAEFIGRALAWADLVDAQRTAEGIVAVARLVGVCAPRDVRLDTNAAHIARASPWYKGPGSAIVPNFGLLLEDVVALPEPVIHTGWHRGYWHIDDATLALVREQYAAARRLRDGGEVAR